MDNQGKTEDIVQKKKKKKKSLLILLLIVLLGIGIVVMHQFGFFHYPWEKPSTMLISVGKEGTLPNMSREEVLAMLQDQADESKVRIQMNPYLTQQDDGKFDFMIQNIETNLFDEDIKIYLGKDSYDELIYESGRLSPGYYIDLDNLLITLDPGNYDAIAYVTFYDGKTQLSTTTVDMKIEVKN